MNADTTDGRPPATLRSELDTSTPTAVVRLAGRLDLHTAVEVRAALDKALATQPVALVVDLTELVAVDDIALTVFSASARAATDWPGCAVMLAVSDPVLRSHLRRLAVDRVAPVHPTRAAALVAAAGTVTRRFRHPLPDTREAPAIARGLVRDACAAWRVDSLIEDAELVVTELVGNSVRHGRPPIELMVTLRERHLHLSVRDRSAAKPRRGLPGVDTGEGGRGLILVDAVAAGWGTTETSDGKIVWASLSR